MKAVSVISNIIGAYGVVFINFAIAVLSLRKKRAIHFLSAALLADFGFMCLAGSFSVRTGYAAFWPNLAVFVPMVLLSPIGSAFASNCLGGRRNDSIFSKIVIAVSGLLYILAAILLASGFSWLTVFMFEYAWLFTTFLTLAILQTVELWPVFDFPPGLRGFYFSLWLDVLLIALMFVAHALALNTFLYAGWTLLIFSLLGCTFIAFRSPETYRLIEEAASAIKYERSSLANVDISASLEKLRSLMDDESLFRDTDLRLEDLARKIGMAPNQLSELINQHKGKNFAGYVNGLRIEYAKRQLESDPEMSVIAIAFESGFNSKSAFNAAFKKETGVTPSEYRASQSVC